MNNKDKLIEALENKCKIEKKFTKEEGRLRHYYQHYLFKLIRELKLMEGDPKKEAVFEAIHEKDDDLNYQRHIQIALDSIDFNDCLCDFINKHFGRVDCINKIEANLNLIGLVNTNDTVGLEVPSDDSISNISSGSYKSPHSNSRSVASFKLKKVAAKSPAVKRKGGLGIVPGNKKKVSLLGSRQAVSSNKNLLAVFGN